MRLLRLLRDGFRQLRAAPHFHSPKLTTHSVNGCRVCCLLQSHTHTLNCAQVLPKCAHAHGLNGMRTKCPGLCESSGAQKRGTARDYGCGCHLDRVNGQGQIRLVRVASTSSALKMRRKRVRECFCSGSLNLGAGCRPRTLASKRVQRTNPLRPLCLGAFAGTWSVSH